MASRITIALPGDESVNIAIFSEMEKVDGQGRYMIIHARWLAAHGHRVIFFSPLSPQLDDLAGADVVHIPIGSVRQIVPLEYEELIGDVARLVEACQEYAIDAMIATAKFPFMMARAALGDRIPIFIPILSPTYFLPHTPRNTIEMRTAAAEGRILANSFDTADIHAAAFGFDVGTVRCSPAAMDGRIHLRPRDRAAVRASLGMSDDDIMVLTINRLDVDKVPAIPPLARAVEVVSQRTGLSVRLVVVGDGTLAEQTRRLCPPSTIFLGTRRDLPDLYEACDIYAGESTTILEAAMAGRPVIVTCATTRPEKPDVAFGVYGVHVLDYAYTTWSSHAPPTPFEEALFYLVADPALRERLARAGHDLVMRRNHVDSVMPWIVDVLAGKPVANSLFGESASALIVVPGGLEDGVDAIAQLCYKRGDELRLGVVFEQPLGWGRSLAIPIEHMQALTLACRRRTTDATPRSRFESGRLTDPKAVPANVRDAFEAISCELPPTSYAPAFTLAPPREPMHAILASSGDEALKLIGELHADEGAVAIVWIPTGEESSASPTLMDRLEAGTKAGVVLIAEPLAWTIIGRLLGAVSTYRDDGSARFEMHRRLAVQLGLRAP